MTEPEAIEEVTREQVGKWQLPEQLVCPECGGSFMLWASRYCGKCGCDQDFIPKRLFQPSAAPARKDEGECPLNGNTPTQQNYET